MKKDFYTIKDITEMFGLTEHTVRYYCDMGLLPVQRDKNNRRIFNQESLNWFEGIKCLRGCGMSIEAIKKYSDLCLNGNSNLEQRYEIIKEQLPNVQKQYDEAKQRLDYIKHKIKDYEDMLSGKIPDKSNPSEWKK
ncbi:MAG: MerR family transcriptional regulator [Anaeroplasma sp.]